MSAIRVCVFCLRQVTVEFPIQRAVCEDCARAVGSPPVKDALLLKLLAAK
jgi:hypothetical protein